MKNLFVLSFVVIFFNIIFSQNNTPEITFVVHSTEVADSESVFIVGSDSQLGDWNPAAVKLFKVNDSTLSKAFIFEEGKILEYKFTKGSVTI